MVNTGLIAELGSLVGDPGRANMLTALLDGRALTARELAERAGVTPQTASGHLKRLLEGGMIQMERQGRHRYHRLASSEVAQMLESMHVAGEHLRPSGRSIRTGPTDLRMRIARTCYDHIAGRLAIMMVDALCGDASSRDYRLTEIGERRLRAWGLDIDPLRVGARPFIKPCLDWSERVPHIAGALGASILRSSLDMGWLQRRSGNRSLEISIIGERGFRSHFGITL